jgi:hypothetical protein
MVESVVSKTQLKRITFKKIKSLSIDWDREWNKHLQLNTFMIVGWRMGIEQSKANLQS